MSHRFLLAFLPLFVAIDPLGILPFFLSLTQGLPAPQKKTIARTAALTAFLLSLSFALGGRIILDYLGLTIWDFSIAGGILLLVLSVSDLLQSQKIPEEEEKSGRTLIRRSLGVVPLGIPVIAGPATLTTALTLSKSGPLWAVVTALLANMLLIYFLLSQSEKVNRILGSTLSSAIGKIFSLLLAAIAVSLIHKGIVGLLTP
ncbi:MAG: MarC family protein [Nitrospirae bacterium]|jgi:multiple antibiotic resistance protein|nr:MarC family protein [Nitrospirota bacterium]